MSNCERGVLTCGPEFLLKPGDVLPYSELSSTGLVNRSILFMVAKFLNFLTKKLGFIFFSVKSTEHELNTHRSLPSTHAYIVSHHEKS
jgi:hypothetical protein